MWSRERSYATQQDIGEMTFFLPLHLLIDPQTASPNAPGARAAPAMMAPVTAVRFHLSCPLTQLPKTNS